MRNFLAILLFAVSSISAEDISLPVLRAGNWLFTRVTINGSDAGIFLLDTAAASNVIDTETANLLELPKIPDVFSQVRVMGLGGIEKATMRKASSIAIGDMTWEHQWIAEMSLENLSKKLNIKINGILGFEFFNKAPFTLDYLQPALIFHLSGFRPHSGLKEIPIKLVNRRPTVEVGFNQQATGWLMIDTGANNTISLQPHFTAQNSALFPSPNPGKIKSTGIGGSFESRISWIPSLDLFTKRLTQVPVLLPDSRTGLLEEATIDGRLGGGLLKDLRLTLSYIQKKGWVEWKMDDAFELWAKSQSNLNQRDILGNTPLTMAAAEGRLRDARILMEAGANPNLRRMDLKTPLILASQYGFVDLVQLLLQKGAQVDLLDNQGSTALMEALKNNKIDIARILLKAGANPGLADSTGKKPADLIREKNLVGLESPPPQP